MAAVEDQVKCSSEGLQALCQGCDHGWKQFPVLEYPWEIELFKECGFGSRENMLAPLMCLVDGSVHVCCHLNIHKVVCDNKKKHI